MSAKAKQITETAAAEHTFDNGHEAARGSVTAIQRARMVMAMAEVCSEIGVANVTVAHVVARSGVSRRTFYEQFADREDCFLAALEEALACAERYVAPAYRQQGRWHQRMRSALVGLLSFLDEEPFMGRLLVVESLAAGTRALERRAKALGRVVAAVDEGRRESKAGEVPPLAAEAVVGGAVSIVHARMLYPGERTLLDLTGPLMGMIVLPYLGSAAAQGEVRRPAPQPADSRKPGRANPLQNLGVRLTYRTVCALTAVAGHPGASNREIGAASDMHDQGQTSKLLARLERLGLIENIGAGHTQGAPNAWTLTAKGAQVQEAIALQHPATASR